MPFDDHPSPPAFGTHLAEVILSHLVAHNDQSQEFQLLKIVSGADNTRIIGFSGNREVHDSADSLLICLLGHNMLADLAIDNLIFVAFYLLFIL